MSEGQNIPEVSPQIPRNAVSIYGQGDAMDDFPVLKAFQQYVDAEHAKAQKRMTTLCIFFVILMVAVIAVFMLLLMNISQRNSALSDQLFQFMLKDRDRQNVIVQSPGQQGDSAALLSLQRQLFDQQMKMMDEAMKARAAAAPAPQERPVSQAERAEFATLRLEHEKQVKTDSDRLAKAQEELKAERERIAQERERLRQKEIDLQRRKLYPDYYEARAKTPAPVVDDDLSVIDEAIAAEEKNVVRPASLRDDGSVRYFTDDEDDLDAFVNALDLPELRKPQPAEPAEKSAAAGGWSMPEE